MHFSLDKEKLIIDFDAEICFAILNPGRVAKNQKTEHVQANIPTLPSGGNPPLCIDTRGQAAGSLVDSWGLTALKEGIANSFILLYAPHLYHMSWFSVISCSPPQWPDSYLGTGPCHLHLVHLLNRTQCLLDACQMCEERDASVN